MYHRLHFNSACHTIKLVIDRECGSNIDDISLVFYENSFKFGIALCILYWMLSTQNPFNICNKKLKSETQILKANSKVHYSSKTFYLKALYNIQIHWLSIYEYMSSVYLIIDFT